MRLSLLFLLLFGPTVSLRRIPSFAGPYLIAVRKVNAERFEGSNATFRVRGKAYVTPFKRGQLQYLWGYSKNEIEINDTMTVYIEISQWANNQWKPNAFVMRFRNACSTAIFHAKPMLQTMFPRDKISCPIPPQFREITNRTVNFVFPQFPLFPYGRWLLTLHLIRPKETETVGIFRAEMDTIPQI